MYNENEYLYLLGYLPRFRQIEKIINKKYINLMKKIIKKKFIKFYSNDFKIDINEAEDLMIKQLRWIKNKINHQLSTEEMIMFIKNNPIKYFSIDYTNITFDYLFFI